MVIFAELVIVLTLNEALLYFELFEDKMLHYFKSVLMENFKDIC